MITCKDITNAKEVEDELREEIARLKAQAAGLSERHTMANKMKNLISAAELRRKAEEKVASQPTSIGELDAKRLLHELQVHQAELEMQNEELHRIIAEKNEHEAHLRNIITQTPAGYFHIDLEGYFLDVNDAWLRMHGYDSKEMVVGKHFSLMQVDSGSASALAHLAELKRGVAIPHGEFDSRRKDGSIGHHIFSAHPVVSAHEIVGFEWFTIDISKSKQAEEELSASEEKYRILFDTAGDSIYINDLQGKIIAVNQQACNTLGFSHAEMMAMAVGAVDTPEQSRFVPERIAKLMQLSRFSFETAHQRKNGSPVPTEVTVSKITWDDQPAMLSICRDITERKRAEEQLAILNDTLESRVKERTAELERLNKELEGFCFSISHEFRAPIARLEAFSKIMTESATIEDKETIAHCAERIEVASKRLRNVVDALLALNRLSRAEMVVFPVNLSEMSQQIVAELLEQSENRRIQITIAPDIVVSGDRYQLEICLRNLLENALKYTAKTDKAAMEFGKLSSDGVETYYVRDNGVGFDMKYSKNLFIPFCRLHSEAEFEGTGVGLATVHRIIEKHNGQIWAEAELGKGATFYFTLGITEGSA